MPYAQTYERQLVARAEVAQGRRDSFFAALTHAPTVTVGRRIAETPSSTTLGCQNIALFKTNRGGLATYHGPGQLMIYMFLDIHKLRIKIRQVVSAIETGIIRWLRQEGIDTICITGTPGVFVDNGKGGVEKIAAIGLNFSRGVSMHGLSLYLIDDDAPFSLIEPCGVKGGLVTSVQSQLDRILSPKGAHEGVVSHIRESILLQRKKG